MANLRDLELGWEGGIRGGTWRGHSGGPSSRDENAVGPRPPGRRKTPIRGCPSSTRESPHRHGSADSHDSVFSILWRTHAYLQLPHTLSPIHTQNTRYPIPSSFFSLAIQMAPSRRASRRQTRPSTLIQGGIRRSRREQRVPARLQEEIATTQERRASNPPPTIALGSEVSETSSETLSSGLSDSLAESEQEPKTQSLPEPLDLPTLNNILQQREDQLVNRILTQLAGVQTMPRPLNQPRPTTQGQPTHLPPPPLYHSTQGIGDEVSDILSTYFPPPTRNHDESASTAMDSVGAWFPVVERTTLILIIENRFQTNEYPPPPRIGKRQSRVTACYQHWGCVF